MAVIDDLHLTDTVKKIFLAGVGAVAAGAEKGKDIVDKSRGVIDDLVKKGEITVEQGKILNQELKHKADEAKDKAEEKAAETEKKDVSSTEKTSDDIDSFVAGLTSEQVEALKAKLNADDASKAEEKPAEKTDAASEKD